MRTETEDDLRTALRQAGAIATFDGQRSMRAVLALAQQHYNALLLLKAHERVRRIQLLDAIFGWPERRG